MGLEHLFWSVSITGSNHPVALIKTKMRSVLKIHIYRQELSLRLAPSLVIVEDC